VNLLVIASFWLTGICASPDQPETVINETCSWLVFDAQGVLDASAAHAIDDIAAPTEVHWALIRSLVFDIEQT
jgi:hypothetical protein